MLKPHNSHIRQPLAEGGFAFQLQGVGGGAWWSPPKVAVRSANGYLLSHTFWRMWQKGKGEGKRGGRNVCGGVVVMCVWGVALACLL